MKLSSHMYPREEIFQKQMSTAWVRAEFGAALMRNVSGLWMCLVALIRRLISQPGKPDLIITAPLSFLRVRMYSKRFWKIFLKMPAWKQPEKILEKHMITIPKFVPF